MKSAAFEFDGVTLPLAALKPIRQVKSTDAAFGKYRAILASVREIGIIEPLIVFPEKGVAESFFVLDGHLRMKALQELERTEAVCLIARDNDVLTYNDKVNRISAIQEHAMILRAIERGVTPEQIAKTLDLDLTQIRGKMNLLDGVHPDAVNLLKDRPIAAGALKLFPQVKPERQVEMAQLMLASDNYTVAYARAMIVGTPTTELVGPKPEQLTRGMSAEEVARMEKEMETLEGELWTYQDHFGENSLRLNAAQRYVKRLLGNAKVQRFLTQRYPDLLEEFQSLAAIETI